jgi:homoserine kinase
MKVFAPVSIGNFSVGFDLLGLAITPVDGELLGDIVGIEAAEHDEVLCSGPYANVLPENPQDNLVSFALELFNAKLKEAAPKKLKPVRLNLEKRLPVGSGLGSSASSIVATLFALNLFYDKEFSVDFLLEMAGELEGKVSGSVHYDNVAPCFLGGLQLMTSNEILPCVSVPFPEHWELVVSYPGIKVSTEKARDILPKQVDMQTAIRFAQNLSVFVHALNNEDDKLAAAMLFDVIAEPHRKSLIPGFDNYKDFAKSVGALGFGISGSGSTVFVVCDNRIVSKRVQNYAESHFCQKGGFSHICKVDDFGVRVVNDVMAEE